MAYPSVKMKGETMSDQQPIASLQNFRSRELTLPLYPVVWTASRRTPPPSTSAAAACSAFEHTWQARAWQERNGITCVASKNIALLALQSRQFILILFSIDGKHHEKVR